MTDFGISKEGIKTKDARTQTFCGTPEYLAPEVLEGKPYGNAVSRKMKLFLEESVIYKKLQIDWWSLGILIYEMMTGYPPFYAEDVQVMYQRILHERIEYEKKFQDSDLISLLCTSSFFLFINLLISINSLFCRWAVGTRSAKKVSRCRHDQEASLLCVNQLGALAC